VTTEGGGTGSEGAGWAARPAPPAITDAPALAPELRVLGLGPVEVWRGERTVTAGEWGSAKPRELLFHLLGHTAGRTKEQIGLALWPEASPAQLRNSFHVTLHHLRRALGGPAWIVFENERYRFDRSLPYEYDVEIFEAHLAEAERLRRDPDADPRRVIEALEVAVRLYRGDFLEETLFGDWLMEAQDALRRRHVDALVALADLHTAAGDLSAAIDAWRRALARDRLLERAHRGLILCLARQGDRDRALAQYRVLEALLRDELGATPQAETRDLHERLLRGETP
jgi:DNA-binding SARP family transcriptional activator